MYSIEERLQRKIKQQKEKSLYRQRQTLADRHGPVVTIQGVNCVNFCSNDYLGLSNHPQIISALKSAADKFGVGSTASSLVCGRTELHQQLEARLAAQTNQQAALTFSSGYLANMALISTLASSSTGIFIDRLAHASLIDAARLSTAKLYRYQHASPESLALAMQRAKHKDKLVITDSIFSMDGDEAPLPALNQLCQDNEALLIIDDAHGFGILGKTGNGSLEKTPLLGQKKPIQVATFSKALGTAGAFIAADAYIIEALIQFGRSYIYTTAQPPILVAATLTALDIVANEAWRREKLTQLIQRFCGGFQKLNKKFALLPSATAIQPLLIGDSNTALQLNQALLKLGFLVTAIRPPTVPMGTARLRISITAAHSEEQIDGLIAALDQCLPNRTDND